MLVAFCGIALSLAPVTPAAAGEPCWSAPDERPGVPADADRRWENGATLAVLFLDGPEDAWGRVAGIANRWTDHANLELTWFAPGTLEPAQAQVRVSFSCPRPGSKIGTDAAAVAAPSPTVCLPYPTGPGDRAFRDAVLHQFGHVLGMVHAPAVLGEGTAWNETAVLADCAAQGWTAASCRQRILTPGEPNAEIYGTHLDGGSIMVSGIPGSWLAATGAAPEIGAADGLAWVDREAAAILYPGHAPVGMTVGVRDSCVDGEPARYRFFDATQGVVWPGPEETWTAGAVGIPVEVELACTPGARICYGAGAGERRWGLGLDGSVRCGDCCYFCSTGRVEPWDLACAGDGTPQKVALKAGNGRYVMAALASGQDGSLQAVSPRVKPWERFRLHVGADGRVSLQAADGRHVEVSPEPPLGDRILRVAADEPGQQAWFRLVEMGGGQVALQAPTGLYVAAGADADATLHATAEQIGAAETFELVILD